MLACALTVAAAAITTSGDADACGGCFIDSASENTVVTGHRMALSISKDKTVLWDQIQYDGNPAEFSWVLPVKPGAVLELANDAFFQVLDAGTQSTVQQAPVQCQPDWGDENWGGEGDGYYGGGDDEFGCGCSDNEAALASEGSSASGGFGTGSGGGGPNSPPPEDVQVVSEETVGPYEVVVLSTMVPGALNDWLDEHNYAVPDELQPTIDSYVAEGFDFIALRLVPGAGVNQMSPVRITTQGASFTLPLRMVAAGTGAQTALSLFIIAEGRYAAENFANSEVDPLSVEWDFVQSGSNYSEVRLDALEENDGHTWLTPFAKRGVFFLAGRRPAGGRWFHLRAVQRRQLDGGHAGDRVRAASDERLRP